MKNLDFKMTQLSFRDSVELNKKSKTLNTYEFYAYMLDKVTTLDTREINDLLLQDVYSILIQYLLEQFENPELASGIFASDFISHEQDYDEKIVKINGYRFSNTHLTLKRAIEAEKYCYIKRDLSLLNFYLLGSTCLKGLKEGVEAILNTSDSNTHRELVKALNNNIGLVSYSKIDLLADLEKVSILDSKNRFISIENEFFFYT